MKNFIIWVITFVIGNLVGASLILFTDNFIIKNLGIITLIFINVFCENFWIKKVEKQ